MKKIVKTITMLLCLMLLTACGGPELLSIMPVYMGGAVTSTHHEFTKDEFYVMAAYDDGTDVEITDYTLEVVGMEKGYYILRFEYEGVDNESYIPIEVDIYPSDFEGETDAPEA